MRKKLILTTAVLFILIGVLHLLANIFSWYWSYWWLDTFMHFLGGAFSGTLTLVLVWPFLERREFKKSIIHISALIGVLVIGTAWEIYEYYFGLTFNAIGNYPLDTAKDFLFDILGAFFVSYRMNRLITPHEQPISN